MNFPLEISLLLPLHTLLPKYCTHTYNKIKRPHRYETYIRLEFKIEKVSTYISLYFVSRFGYCTQKCNIRIDV